MCADVVVEGTSVDEGPTASPPKWAFPRVFILARLTISPHTASQLTNEPGLPREDVDKHLRWLIHRGLVAHHGAWTITQEGREQLFISMGAPRDGDAKLSSSADDGSTRNSAPNPSEDGQ